LWVREEIQTMSWKIKVNIMFGVPYGCTFRQDI
jgi:hypothetical protein